MKAQVSIIMGSTSDLEIMSQAFKIFDTLNIPYEKKVMSAHRTPDIVSTYAVGLIDAGIKVMIAGAGGAAHLPGVVAAYTTIPVIGVPILTKSLGGIDSLLSIVQMPSGIPVATVGINASANAALLAASILSLSDPKVKESLEQYRASLKEKVLNTVL